MIVKWFNQWATTLWLTIENLTLVFSYSLFVSIRMIVKKANELVRHYLWYPPTGQKIFTTTMNWEDRKRQRTYVFADEPSAKCVFWSNVNFVTLLFLVVKLFTVLFIAVRFFLDRREDVFLRALLWLLWMFWLELCRRSLVILLLAWITDEVTDWLVW